MARLLALVADAFLACLRWTVAGKMTGLATVVALLGSLTTTTSSSLSAVTRHMADSTTRIARLSTAASTSTEATSSRVATTSLVRAPAVALTATAAAA